MNDQEVTVEVEVAGILYRHRFLNVKGWYMDDGLLCLYGPDENEIAAFSHARVISVCRRQEAAA